MSTTQDLGQQQLVETIEASFHVLDEAVGVLSKLEIPGVRGRIGPSSHPGLNSVGMARLDEATADTVIREVIHRFAAERRPFGWLVGPGSTPADLPNRLEAAGLHKFGEAAGLALTELTPPVANPAVRVEEVTWRELRREADMMAAAFGFGMTRDDTSAMVDALEVLGDRFRSRGYLAFAGDPEIPVAFSSMSDTDLPGVVYLPLAATLAEHRGRGIYRSMVARRVADARDAGAWAVVTQAVRATSAPVLKRMGFAELSSLELYAWTPEEP